jgi:hypothetical protein
MLVFLQYNPQFSNRFRARCSKLSFRFSRNNVRSTSSMNSPTLSLFRSS